MLFWNGKNSQEAAKLYVQQINKTKQTECTNIHSEVLGVAQVREVYLTYSWPQDASSSCDPSRRYFRHSRSPLIVMARTDTTSAQKRCKERWPSDHKVRCYKPFKWKHSHFSLVSTSGKKLRKTWIPVNKTTQSIESQIWLHQNEFSPVAMA